MLLFEQKIQGDKNAFISKINKVASDLGIPANWIMAIINSESGFSPSIQNKYTQATGLIQFMPSTAKALGTTVDALKRMTSVQQLDYVEKYFAPYKNYIDSFEDLYLVTFYPNADGKFAGTLSKPDNWTFPKIVTQQNPGLDKNGDGLINIKEFRDFAYSHVPDQLQNLLVITQKKIKKNIGFVILGFVLLAIAIFILYYQLYRGKSVVTLAKQTL